MKLNTYEIAAMDEERNEFFKIKRVPKSYHHLFGVDKHGDPILDYPSFLLIDSKTKDKLNAQIKKLFSDKNRGNFESVNPGDWSLFKQCEREIITQEDLVEHIRETGRLLLKLNSQVKEQFGQGFVNEFIDRNDPEGWKEAYRILYCLYDYMPSYYSYMIGCVEAKAM